MKRLVLVTMLGIMLLVGIPLTVIPHLADAAPIAYYIHPDGNDVSPGTSPQAPLETIQQAVDLAQPGDTIYLAPGDYDQDVVSRRNGTADAPITITGSADAVIRGGGNGRIVEINHDYLTLEGFTIDGLAGSAGDSSSYRDKLLYVLGTEHHDGVTGLKVLQMTFRNAGGECVRLRYFARQNEIAYSTFRNCGMHDFAFGAGGKNGEGVYIGTAPEQRGDGKNPSTDPDQSNDNWIHHNDFDIQGNECVDIKEAASGNIVEYNSCTGQRDPNSAGLDARGSGNIFRFNDVFGNVGAGVRLGGDGETDGINNDVYGNRLSENQGGAVKLQRAPQGQICGNIVSNNAKGEAVGTYGGFFDPTIDCAEDISMPNIAPTSSPTTTPLPTEVPPEAVPLIEPTIPVPPPATAPDDSSDVNPPAEGAVEEYPVTFDTYISSDEADTSFGDAVSLKVDQTPEQWSLLRFDLPTGDLAGRRLQLRLFVNNSADVGGTVYAVADTWDEQVTWNTRPALGAQLATIGSVEEDTWVTVDITDAPRDTGSVMLAIVPQSEDAAGYRSQQNKPEYAPILFVE